MAKAKTLLSCVALIALASPALAQAQNVSSGTVPPANGAQIQGGSQSQNVVEEIVVTAQRRRERLQDVPIVVNAVKGDQLAKEGVTTTQDLSTAIAGVDVGRITNTTQLFIRGVGFPGFATGEDAAVAMYVDGVYQATGAGTYFSMNNIDRVEVLKGPQGTLFGRNAEGGAIQIITKDPSPDFYAKGEVGYGNYATVHGSLYATTGISDTVSADIALYWSDRADGWGKYVNYGHDAYTASEYAARTKVLWTPSDETAVKLALDTNQTRGQDGIGWVALPGTKLLDGRGTVGFYSPRGNPENEKTTQWGATLTLKQDLGFADLNSITAYRSVRSYYDLDQDNTPIDLLFAADYGTQNTFSQETQLVSKSDSKLQWIFGFYYLHDRPFVDPLVIQGEFIAPLQQLNEYSSQSTESYATFGQATYPVFEDTNATIGLRYTIDNRSIGGSQSANGIGLLVSSPEDANTVNFEKLTWRFAIDHHISKDVMVYASYNRGFKAGNYNPPFFKDNPVRPEVLDAYEAGVKTELFDRKLRFNLAGFYYDWTDMQVAINIPGAAIMANAAAARLYGLDADFSAVVTDNLELRGSLNYTNSKFNSFPDGAGYVLLPSGGAANVTRDLAGNELPHAPPLTFNITANYVVPFRDGNLDLTATYAYNSGFYWYADNQTKQPSYNTINASLGWQAPDDRWGVKFWVQNLLGEEYYAYVSESPFGFAGSPAAPRTFGFTLNYALGE